MQSFGRQQHLHTELSRNWNVSEYLNFQQCIDHLEETYVDQTHRCSTRYCEQFNSHAHRQIRVERVPHILMHLYDVPVHARFVLEDFVQFNGATYRLFAGIYVKGNNHFVARIRRGDRVFHYDGMENSAAESSRCTEVAKSSDTPFPVQISYRSGGASHSKMLGFIYKQYNVA